jgi:hypothetical protein
LLEGESFRNHNNMPGVSGDNCGETTMSVFPVAKARNDNGSSRFNVRVLAVPNDARDVYSRDDGWFSDDTGTAF